MLLDIKKIVLICLLSSSLFSKSNTQIAGDVLLVTLPLAVYGTTLYIDDKEGEFQFYKTTGVTVGASYLLKYSVQEERPDKSDNHSFPSAHTSITFASSGFVHKRYGFKYAIPAYLASIYTGYSRVQSDKHYTHDVVAGAVLGLATSWYFSSSYRGVDIKPIVSNDFQGVLLSYRW